MILVIGYGNTLRRDDGIGPKVAEELARQKIPGVQVITVCQLTPELAEPVSGASMAVFVDARIDQEVPVVVTPLTQATHSESFTHVQSPASVLTFAQAVYGQAPPAYLVTVAGQDFDLGEELSAAGRDNLRHALVTIAHLLKESERL